MQKMKSSYLKILCFMLFLMFINFDVYASSPNKCIVDKNKIWSITFSENLNYSKLSKDSIIVTDDLGNKENIIIINGPSINMLTVLPPSCVLQVENA